MGSPACDLVLFGAMGDLGSKKLFPALYHLYRAGLLGESSRILALARRDLSEEDARQQIGEALGENLGVHGVDATTRDRGRGRGGWRPTRSPGQGAAKGRCLTSTC